MPVTIYHNPRCSKLRQAIADNPALLQRPIVVNGDRASIGRPSEIVLEIL